MSTAHEGSSGWNNYAPASEEVGREIGKNSGVWKTYIEEAELSDGDMLKSWNASIDTLLIFAALFSAIVTAFIIESYKLMQPDFTELTYYALAHPTSNASSQETFAVPSDARLVNCLWLASLISSLLTSLIGILAKQWLVAYTSDLPLKDTAREWACTRQFRYDALRAWRVPELIAWLPVLLHVAFLLFLAGLTLFFRSIDGATTLVILTLSAAVYAFYGVTTVSPLLANSAPFRSPLTPLLRRVIAVATRLGRPGTTFDPWSDASRSDSTLWKSIANAIAWLILRSSVDGVRYTALYALGDVTEGQKLCESLSRSQQRDLKKLLCDVDIYSLSLPDLGRHFNTVLNLAEPWVWGITKAFGPDLSRTSSVSSLYEPLALRPRRVTKKNLRGSRASFKYWYTSHFIGKVPDEYALVVIHLVLDQIYPPTAGQHVLERLSPASVDVIERAINDATLDELLDVELKLRPASVLRLAHALVMFHRSGIAVPPRPRLKAYLNLVNAYAMSALHLGGFTSGCSVLFKLLLHALPHVKNGQWNPPDAWGVISVLSRILDSTEPDITAITSRDDDARLLLQSMTVILNLCRQFLSAESRRYYFSCWLKVLERPRYVALTNWTWFVVDTFTDFALQVDERVYETYRALENILSLRAHPDIPDPWSTFHRCVVGILCPNGVRECVLDLVLTHRTLANVNFRSPRFATNFLAIAEALASAHAVVDAPSFEYLQFVVICSEAARNVPSLRHRGGWDIVVAFRVAFSEFLRHLSLAESQAPSPPGSAKRLLSAFASFATAAPSSYCWPGIANVLISVLTPLTLRAIQSAQRRVQILRQLSAPEIQRMQDEIDFVPALAMFLEAIDFAIPEWLPKSTFSPVELVVTNTPPLPPLPHTLDSSYPSAEPAHSSLAVARWNPVVARARGREDLYPRLISHALAQGTGELRRHLDTTVLAEMSMPLDSLGTGAANRTSWPFILLPRSMRRADIQRALLQSTISQYNAIERRVPPVVHIPSITPLENDNDPGDTENSAGGVGTA